MAAVRVVGRRGVAGVRAGGVVLGVEGLRPWSQRWSPSSTTLLLDENVADARVAESVAACLPGRTRVRVLAGAGTTAGVTELACDLVGATCVVAVGGGALIDRAKLAVAVAADPRVLPLLEPTGREGLVVLPEDVARAPAALAVVPTTVGTGSERSRNAVVGSRSGRSLVVGSQLLPDLAVLDPEATRTLPRDMLLEGCFEALARTAGPYVGSHGTASGDQLAEAVVTRLVALGTTLAALPEPGAAEADGARLELARLSGLSHTGDMQAGRDPYGFTAWYVSHELSWVLGVTKARALATVLPTVWAHVLAGRPGWGCADRLQAIWTAAAAGGPDPLPVDPAEGLVQLLDRWGVRRQTHIADVDRAASARRVVHRWGDGLPFLGMLEIGDVTALMEHCADGATRRQDVETTPR